MWMPITGKGIMFPESSLMKKEGRYIMGYGFLPFLPLKAAA